MFAESIDVILKIWESEPPYDIDLPGNRFKVSTRKNFDPTFGTGIMPKPFQKPRPEIVGTVVAPFSKGVVIMGERDFHPLSANFLLPHWLKSHWTNYAEGKTKAGLKPDPADWRVARTLFVADDDKVAAAYGRHDANSPYRFYYKQLQTKLTKAGRHVVFKERADQPDSEISYDFVLDRLCMYGTVNKVVDQILALREQTGDFGELVYAGMDWVDPRLEKRSMQLMAEQVMPRVNAAIAKERRAA
jgi:alkanesulfonate monooxygenase SsuD/methylene tetrahydromethanopterin reductase-like flavin-dependent oxidoreductase (luciferase family)